MLQEGVSDHRHQCMTVKAVPGPSLEVIKAEFFLHLLVSLPQTHRAFIVAAKLRRSVFAGRLAR